MSQFIKIQFHLLYLRALVKWLFEFANLDFQRANSQWILSRTTYLSRRLQTLEPIKRWRCKKLNRIVFYLNIFLFTARINMNCHPFKSEWGRIERTSTGSLVLSLLIHCLFPLNSTPSDWYLMAITFSDSRWTGEEFKRSSWTLSLSSNG